MERQVRSPGHIHTIAWRLWRPLWQKEEAFDRLLSWLQQKATLVDEVALFTDFIHVPGKPLGEVAEDTALFRTRLGQLRDIGVPSVGLNVLGTLGHGIHHGARPMGLPHTVLSDGLAGHGACVNTPQMRQYAADSYALMAQAGPDFMWLDDDLRIDAGECFCKSCLRGFGWDRTREDLVAALDRDHDSALRTRWNDFLADSLVGLCGVIERAVHHEAASVELGLMTVGLSRGAYGHYPISRMMEALGASRGRPGHGYYTDARPREIVSKVMDVACQTMRYPAAVESRQYELEDWPYVTMDKAVRTHVHEVTLAAMAGCTGVALNVLAETTRDFPEYEPLTQALGESRDLWSALRDQLDDTELCGFWIAHDDRMASRPTDAGREWLDEVRNPPVFGPLAIAELGIPVTARLDGSWGAFLTRPAAEGMDDKTLERLLAGGVFMDAAALRVLGCRGLGELCGVAPGPRHEHVFERLTSHPLNAEGQGEGRRTMHGADSADALVALAPDVQILAHLVSQVTGTPVGVGMSAWENPLGGRVVVASYAPWTSLARGAKQRQLRRVLDWLSRGRQPVLIETPGRIWPLIRTDAAETRVVISLMNLSLDPSPPLALRISYPIRAVERLLATGRQAMDVVTLEHGVTHVSMPPLDAWSCAVLTGHSETEGETR